MPHQMKELSLKSNTLKTKSTNNIINALYQCILLVIPPYSTFISKQIFKNEMFLNSGLNSLLGTDYSALQMVSL